MTDVTTESVPSPQHDRTEPVDIEFEMQRSYIDYAMSVIVGRALPDVRDGLKPVHTRVLYAMYDGGYRPERGYSKCSRVVGDVMGQYHPHGDSAIYDPPSGWARTGRCVTRSSTARQLRLAGQRPARGHALHRVPPGRWPWRCCGTSIRRPSISAPTTMAGPPSLSDCPPGSRTCSSTGPKASRSHGHQDPADNLREVAEGVRWYLENFDASDEDLLEALMQRVKGPDFPTRGLIVGRRGIQDAYRTGRGSITMRAVVEVEEDQRGRPCLVATELSFQVNPDNLASKIAELVKDGRVTGIADVRDETSLRTGQRLVIVLKRDAIPKVVLNNLYKHTQLQDTFGANMMALVDSVPRTLRLDQFIRYWVAHQIEVIIRRTRYLLRKAQERAHILSALLKAIDRIDEVIALIRGSASAAAAQQGLMGMLEIDEIQARAILDMQLRKLAALERQELVEEYDGLMTKIADYEDILASPIRQRTIVGDELAETVERYGDERRTEIIAYDGDVTDEDLIAEEDVVVTITHGGYAKRTKTDLYRAQRRGGKGVRGAQLRTDDIVDHFFVTTTHHWILFFTNKGRVYRAKAYELPEAARDARGQHVANLLAFQPDETIAEVLALRDYQVAPYLVLATKTGLVKKSRLSDFDSPRSGGIIAINLREDDEVIAARLVAPEEDLLLVSSKAQALRFQASDGSLRPMGRATSGVIGMRFADGDELLDMYVFRDDEDVLVATEGGYAKRTPADQYPVKNRGGMGVVTARIVETRGRLVGALMVRPDDEIFAITSAGGVIRTRAGEVSDPAGRPWVSG